MENQVNLLLVEDNPTDVLLVRANLALALGTRFTVTAVNYLAAAIEQARSGAYDIILLDLGLPDSQGLATFELMRANVRETPIIILTGLGDDQVALQAVHRGAQDFLPKLHVTSEFLVRAIQYAIGRNHAQIERERYAAELFKLNQELLEELRMAREIQQALLPHEYPHFRAHHNSLHFAHYYRAAAVLSGDFFSVLRLSDNKAGVLICDVMGHGIRAALIGTLARGLVDQFLPAASQPGILLGLLNRELSRTFKQAEISAFVTAFYYVADLAERKITYANAGHPNALILRRDDQTVDWLRVDGRHKPPLGLLDHMNYPSFSVALAPRDSIMLFTDGLYEKENAKGEQFGRERLMAAVNRRMKLPCGEMIDGLVTESQEFSGSEDFADDVCLVGMDVINHPEFHEPAA